MTKVNDWHREILSDMRICLKSTDSDRVIKNTEIKLYSKREREFFLSSPIQLKLNQTNK